MLSIMMKMKVICMIRRKVEGYDLDKTKDSKIIWGEVPHWFAKIRKPRTKGSVFTFETVLIVDLICTHVTCPKQLPPT